MNSLANGAVERKSNNEFEKQEIVNSSGWVRSRKNSTSDIATRERSTDSDNAFLSGALTQDHTDEEIAQMVSWLRILIGEGNVAELRAVTDRNGEQSYLLIKFGFFDSDHFEQMAQAALQLTPTAEGVYFTLNPVNKALLNRCWNGVGTAKKGDVTTDADIVDRRWLLVDADPVRVAKVSATEDEKSKAHETIQQVRDYLTSQCWPLPVLADSGNGYHLLYRIELPVEDGQLVKRVLKALHERFSNPAVKIDTFVFNPSRIVKLYGTIARKGEATPERPHRKSRLLESPSEPKVVPLELLEALAAETKAESSRHQTTFVISPEVLADREGAMQRARSYLKKLPGAVSGEHGHDQTYKAACVLVRDFALSIDEAWPLIQEWNQSCEPPWDEKDLRRKLTEADKKDGPRGDKLHNNARSHGADSVEAAKQDDDPHRLARLFLKNRYTQDDEGTLRYWRGEWWRWEAGSYRVLSEVELRAQLWADIEIEFNRINTERRSQRTSQVMAGEQPAGKPPRADKVSNSLVSNVLGALTGLTTLRNDIEQPSWLLDGQKSQRCNYIALRNGLLDVDAHLAGQKEVLKPHSPRWFSPVCLPYDYETNAQCSKWEAFLQKNLEEDAERIALLQEWFGYSLTVDTSRQRFLLLEGEGSNGKSVVCAVLTAVLGEGNVSHVPLEAFGERFALKQTLGKLANIASEVGEIDRVAEGKLKSFTSGDRMTFDRKGIDAIEALPTARLVLATNNRPRFSDRSGGVWRRMLLLPFHVEIQPKERVYGMDQSSWWMEQGELPAIFNWAVEGLRRLRQQKRFTEPAVCQEAMREYRMECNPARTFLQEHCETKRDSSVETIHLFEGFRDWCEANGYHPLGSGMFGKEVSRVFPKAVKKKQGSRESRQNVYEGIEYRGLPFQMSKASRARRYA